MRRVVLRGSQGKQVIRLLLVVNQLLDQGIRVIVLVLRLLKLTDQATLTDLPLVQVGPREMRDDVCLLDQCGVAHDSPTAQVLILNRTVVINVRGGETVLRHVQRDALLVSVFLMMKQGLPLWAEGVGRGRRFHKDVVPP